MQKPKVKFLNAEGFQFRKVDCTMHVIKCYGVQVRSQFLKERADKAFPVDEEERNYLEGLRNTDRWLSFSYTEYTLPCYWPGTEESLRNYIRQRYRNYAKVAEIQFDMSQLKIE